MQSLSCTFSCCLIFVLLWCTKCSVCVSLRLLFSCLVTRARQNNLWGRVKPQVIGKVVARGPSQFFSVGEVWTHIYCNWARLGSNTGLCGPTVATHWSHLAKLEDIASMVLLNHQLQPSQHTSSLYECTGHIGLSPSNNQQIHKVLSCLSPVRPIGQKRAHL